LEVSTDGKIISKNQDAQSFEIKIYNETQNGHGTLKKTIHESLTLCYTHWLFTKLTLLKTA